MLAVGAHMIGGTAGAQENAASADSLAEVVVTGSRIVRKDIEAVSPVATLSGEDLAQRGYSNYDELLFHVPQLDMSESLLNNDGRTYINLRGLGAARSLVLIDGRRLQSGGFGTAADSGAPDPSLIPPALIKSVEVLTGGASSVYGADAVAGVVNFILDKNFEGFKISGNLAGFQHDNRNSYMQGIVADRGDPTSKGNTFDGPQYGLDLMAGTHFADGKGHITAYLDWAMTTEVSMYNRDYTACPLDSTNQCSGSFTAGDPNFYFPAIDASKTLQKDGALAPYSNNLENWGRYLSTYSPTKRVRSGMFVNFDVSDHFKPYAEFNYMRTQNSNYYDPPGTFGLPVNVSCSSPLLSASQQATICGSQGLNLGPNDTFVVDLYKRSVEGGQQYWDRVYNSFRAVTGVGGDIAAGWHYDVSLLYGNTDSSQVGLNQMSRSRIVNAMTLTTDADGKTVCASGADCVPYLLFTPGGITKAALDYIAANAYVVGRSTELVANGYVSGNLPLTLPTAGHPVALVLGTEYRKETMSTTFDDATHRGDLSEAGQQTDTRGSYDVKEFFTEAAIPLIENLPFAKDVSAELGYRHSKYDISGSNSTWKVGLNYRPIKELKFRVGFNRAVRVPNINELFLPQSTGIWTGTDPCSGATPLYTAAQCARTGVSAANYGHVSANPDAEFNQTLGGNPHLQPETANTTTFGVVMSPVEHLNVSIDYWDIKISNVISAVAPQTAVNQCALNGTAELCSLIHRAPDGNLWLDLQTGTGGYIEATNENVGMWHFRGLDALVDYQWRLAPGTVKLALNGTRFLKKQYENISGVASTQYSCEGLLTTSCPFATPKWRHSFDVTYMANSFWNVGLTWRYVGAVADPGVTGIDGGIGAQSYFDVNGTMRFGDDWVISGGVNNLLDKEPPLVSLNLSGNYYNTPNGPYDQLGRFLHLSVSKRF